MYTNILVVTDRSDIGETPIRQRVPWRARFLNRVRSVTLDLLFPTVSTTGPTDEITEAIEIRTDNATHHAIDLAVAHDARLHLLYFIDAVRYDTSFESAVEPLEEEGEAVVDRIVDTAERGGVDVTSTIEIGRPIELVLEYVAEHDVDLIVMNTRGSVGVRELVGGSVTSSVIRQAEVPVYTVPLDGSDTPDGG